MNECADTDGLLQPYVDGELPHSDRAVLEEHMAKCEACRKRVQRELTFVACVRARLSPPLADPELSHRVASKLAGSGEFPAGRSIPLPAIPLPATPLPATPPTSAPGVRPLRGWPTRRRRVSVATACLVFGIAALAFWLLRESPPSSPAEFDLIASHLDQPIELSLEQPERVPQQIQAHVGVWTPLPEFRARRTGNRVAPLRARVVRLPDGRRAAHIDYEIRYEIASISPVAQPSPNIRLAVYAFDPTGVRVPAGRVARVADTDVLTRSARGMTMAFYVKDGVGFAAISSLREQDLLALISRHVSGQKFDRTDRD